MGLRIRLLDGKNFGKLLFTVTEFSRALSRLAQLGIDEAFVDGELIDDDRRWTGILDVPRAQAALAGNEW